jgi:hypothetical protein
MAEIITLTFFFSVWMISASLGWLLRTYAPTASQQSDYIANAGLATAMLGGVALWLLFTSGGVTAAG